MVVARVSFTNRARAVVYVWPEALTRLAYRVQVACRPEDWMDLAARRRAILVLWTELYERELLGG